MIGNNACGYSFCPAPARLFWNMDGLTVKHAAKMCGVAPASLHRHAERLGLGNRWRVKHRLKIPLSRLKAAWLDELTPLPVLSESLGIYMRYFQQIAVEKGWPPRRHGRKTEYQWPRDFDEMYRAGVSLREIAASAGSKHFQTAADEVRRRGLPPRPKARRKGMTMAEYKLQASQGEYAAQIAEAARQESAAARATWR